MQPEQRRALILSAALSLAQVRGFQNVRQTDVAALAGTSRALVIHYFGTMDQLKTEVMREAVAREDRGVLLQGLVANHPEALAAPVELKRAAAEAL